MKPSVAEFLKMSPASRAAYMKKTRGNSGSRAVVVKNVALTRGAPVVRETVRRVPVPRKYMKVVGPGRNLRTVGRQRNSPTRMAARKIVEDAIRKLIDAQPVPLPKKTSPVQVVSKPVKKTSPPRVPSPVAPRLVAMKERSSKANRRFRWRTAYSPNTGRMKIEGNKGRLAYVHGTGVSMAHLKKIAADYGVSIKGLRRKVNIANRIFRA